MRPTLLFYCLTPNDFTRQRESADGQWVKSEKIVHARAHSTQEKSYIGEPERIHRISTECWQTLLKTSGLILIVAGN
jgi:hypothetical protein